jgi:hypothetical protein
MQDGSKNWSLLKTASHSDRTDWSYIPRYLHSPEASYENNDHKDLVRVKTGINEKRIYTYEFHRCRTLIDSKDALRLQFTSTLHFALMSDDFRQKKVGQRLRQAQVPARKAANARGEVFTLLSLHPPI